MAERDALQTALADRARQAAAAGLDRPDLEALVAAALDAEFGRG